MAKKHGAKLWQIHYRHTGLKASYAWRKADTKQPSNVISFETGQQKSMMLSYKESENAEWWNTIYDALSDLQD